MGNLEYNDLKNSERSYPTDYKLENGNYLNKCIKCNNTFIGHKNRTICKKCSVEVLSMSKEWQIIKYDTFRTKKQLSLFGFIIGSDGGFYWTGKFFKKVDVIEQKIIERTMYFDEWDYVMRWSKWSDEKWYFYKLK